ncbi:hypothetical protein C8Q80DRAFT_1141505 [Daedaleopsis nitida]|nr:hypothetical protein C8Q80DRAFT_1141505 [Daedaleopsis nitida]
MLGQQLGDAASLLGAVVTVVCLGLVMRRLRLGRFGDRLPPGPPGHWLFGNTPPPSHAYRYYSDLAEIYGPVYTMRYGARNVVVIGRIQLSRTTPSQRRFRMTELFLRLL